MVAKTVTITLRSVVVEHPHPRAFVRSSKRSEESGHMSLLETGSKREFAGTQEKLDAHHPQPCLLLMQVLQSWMFQQASVRWFLLTLNAI